MVESGYGEEQRGVEQQEVELGQRNRRRCDARAVALGRRVAALSLHLLIEEILDQLLLEAIAQIRQHLARADGAAVVGFHLPRALRDERLSLSEGDLDARARAPVAGAADAVLLENLPTHS